MRKIFVFILFVLLMVSIAHFLYGFHTFLNGADFYDILGYLFLPSSITLCISKIFLWICEEYCDEEYDLWS